MPAIYTQPRITWRFLRDSTREQILAVANPALAADQKLVQGTILERLFDNTPTSNEWGHSVFSLYNGDDVLPPPYLGKSFTGPHNHYLVGEGEQIDSGDIDLAAKLARKHGYSPEPNSRLLAFVNPAQAEVISTFRAGVENNNTAIAKHGYIPSAGAPAYLMPDNLVGQVAPESFAGLKVQGSYGDVWIIQSDFIPEDYLDWETFDRFEAIGALSAAHRKSLRRADAVHHGESRSRQKRLAPPQRGRRSRRRGDKRCAEFESDEFRQLVRLLRTLGDMSPTAGAELSS